VLRRRVLGGCAAGALVAGAFGTVPVRRAGEALLTGFLSLLRRPGR
jgi:hypothetical protein